MIEKIRNLNKSFLAAIIIFVVLFGVLGFGLYTYWPRDNNQVAKEIRIIPESIKPASASVETARTEDGQTVATFLSYPKYYQDEKKEWQPVDTSIQKNEDAKTKLLNGAKADWKVEKGVWKFYATNDGAVSSDNAGIILETKIQALVYFDAKSKKYASIYDVKPVQPVVTENKIVWSNIIEGVDYKITYINDILKEDIVMSDAARKKLPLPESLGIPSDWAYLGFLFDRSKEQVGGLTAFAVDKDGRKEVEYGKKNFETEGSVQFVNAQGSTVQTIEAGYTTLNVENSKSEARNSKQIQNSKLEIQNSSDRLPLLKRFYKENLGKAAGKKFLFSGSKFSDIQNLGGGDLIFDPTIIFQKTGGLVNSEVDDIANAFGTCYADCGAFYTAANQIRGSQTTIEISSITNAYESWDFCGLMKFPSAFGPGTGQINSGSTIINAYLNINSGIGGTEGTINVYGILDSWTEGNVDLVEAAAGKFGATWANAQTKYDSETAYINDGDGVTASDTTITVDNGSGGGITIADWPSSGIFKIDNEVFTYADRNSTGFFGLKRGVNGTTAATHADNATINGNVAWRNAGPSGASRGSLLTDFTWSADTAYNLEVTAAVQAWADNPVSNNGIVFINPGGAADLISSENSDIFKRPRLIVFYTTLESGKAGLVNAHESADTTVSPTNPGATTTIQNFELATEAEDSGFWTTALSETDGGYDSQVFKFQAPTPQNSPVYIRWQGHGESAPATNTVAFNIWNFNNSSWETLASGSARYNDVFTDKTAALNASTSWSTNIINALAFDSANNMIYIGGGAVSNSKFARYDPAGDIFTNLPSKADNEIYSMVFDSVNREVYLAEYNGIFEKYNPPTNSVTPLSSKINSFWGTVRIHALAFDSANKTIYLVGDSGHFAKYDPSTGIATDLSSKIPSWSSSAIRALTYDSLNNIIYLGGGNGKFAKYDPATDAVTDLTSILNWPPATDLIKTLIFDSNSNVVYIAGQAAGGYPKFFKYIPADNIAEDLISYLPSTMGVAPLNASSYDTYNKTVYLAGGAGGGSMARVVRYFPASFSSQSLTNTVYDAIGNITLNTSAFDTANKALYIGGESGKFGKYAVAGNTTLTGTITTNIQNYRDSSGYAWLWVKATNEWSPPSVSGIAGAPAVTWTSGEGVDGAIAYSTISHPSGSWDDYVNDTGAGMHGVVYEADAGWKTSHSVTVPIYTCGVTQYYRVRSCDQWGSCTVSAEYSFYTGDCSSSCAYVYTWDGQQFNFETDLYGSGGLAFMRGPNLLKPMPHRIYQINKVVPKDGQIELPIFEDLDEIDYLDRFQLLSYLVPEGSTFGLNIPPFEPAGVGKPLVIHTLGKELIRPVKAVRLDTNKDVTEQISEVDDKRMVFSPDKENFSPTTFEVDFGDLTKYPQKKLVITGESVFPKSEEGIARRKLFPQGQYIEVVNKEGKWVKVPDTKLLFSKPTSFEGRQALDISNIFLTSDTRMRITYAYKTYINQFAFDGTQDLELPEPEIVPMESAELSYSGIYHNHEEDGGTPDYYRTTSNKNYEFHPGRYTSYGDVSELLKNQDDKFVIMSRGDKILTKFKYPDPAPAGYRRLYIMDTWGYYKSIVSQTELQVDPLPFAAMSTFPYPAEEYLYNNNSDYQKYLSDYNTRELGNGKIPVDYLPWQERARWKLEKMYDQAKDWLDDLINRSLSVIGRGKKIIGEHTMHNENNPGSADTDLIEVYTEDAEVKIQGGGVRIQGGVKVGQ